MASWLAPALLSKLAGRFVLLVRNGQQQMLGRDELVLEILGFLKCPLENLVQGGRDVHTRLPAPETFGADPIMRSASCTIASGLHVAFFEHRTHDALLLAGQRDEQMQRCQCLVLILLRDALAPC